MFSDVRDSGIVKKAQAVAIKTIVRESKAFKTRAEYEDFVWKLLHENPFDLLVLAGYMKILSPRTVRDFEGKIVNIHPALLPAFPGIHAIKKAFKCGVKYTGITIHFVDEGIDTGKIIKQVPIKILPNDTLKSLEERIHRIEHRIYPRVIEDILEERITL